MEEKSKSQNLISVILVCILIVLFVLCFTLKVPEQNKWIIDKLLDLISQAEIATIIWLYKENKN